MLQTNLDQILLKLILEAASKVNHDLLGSMHVVNFCAEEIASDAVMSQEARIKDYALKLRHSTEQMAQTIRLSREVINTVKGIMAQGEERSLNLSDGLKFSYALSQLFQRHLPPLALEIKLGKRLRSMQVQIEETFILSFIFDWVAAHHPTDGKMLSLVFEEDEGPGIVKFSLPSGIIQADSIEIDLVEGKHPLYKYLECLGKQSFVSKLTKDRDIIGLLRSTEDRDFYFLHLDLFQREFQAALN